MSPDRHLRAGGLISRRTLAAAAPGLNLEGVTAGAQWFDAQIMDSERLTFAFAPGLLRQPSAGRARAGRRQVVLGTDGVLAGEIAYNIEREHARTLGDLLRRTGISSTGRPSRQTLHTVSRMAASRLGWEAAEQARQVDEVLNWPTYLPNVSCGPGGRDDGQTQQEGQLYIRGQEQRVRRSAMS